MENTQDLRSGRTSQEPSAATVERTSASSSRKSQKSLTKPYLFLSLRRASGQQQDTWTVTDGPLPGEPWTPNTTECPNVAVGSYLSQILQVNAPEKYHLSARACEGILRRASRRGNQLPPMLQEALEEMILADL